MNLHTDGKSYSPEAWIEAFSSSGSEEQKAVADWISVWLSDTKELSVQTSGSTGTPSTITLPKAAFVASAKLTANHFELGADSKAVLALPVVYIAGKMMIVRALVNDWDLWVFPPSSSPTIPRDLDFDFAAFTPMQASKMIDAGTWPQVKKVILGGAPVSAHLEKQLRLVRTTCYETYGMTETLTHIATRLLSKNGEQDTFQTIGNCSVDTSAESQLIILAPHINQHPFVTQDLAELISEKRFHLLGRADDVINSGGIKIHPQILEREISDLIPYPFYITKATDQVLYEEMVLVIESERLSAEESNEMLTRLSKKLGRIRAPRKIRFMLPFQRTASGKTKRILPPKP